MGAGEGANIMTKEQKIINASIRLALRTGNLPYQFQDKDEKDYRKIVYSVGRELGIKFKVQKVGDLWTICIA